MKDWPKSIFKLFLLISSGLIISTSCAEEMTLRQEFGIAFDIIKRNSFAEIARLKVVSVEESRQQVFKTTDRIAGYPVLGKLVNLNIKTSQELVSLLLDKNNYANIRQRCQNQFFHGIRFSKDKQKIEFALGIPCNQVLIAFKNKEKIEWWGGVLGNKAAKQVQSLLRE